MTTATSSFAWSNTAAADTRIWLNGVHDLVTAAGLVATTDTGQLDSTTITSAQGVNVTLGFQVFKFPDTLQATAPIFVKLTYSTDSNARPRVAASVSSSTNGAGTVGSPSYDVPIGAMSAFQSPLNSYACCVDGTFSMVLGYSYTSGGANANCVCALVVDRARDATGTALAAGYLCESNYQPSQALAQSRSMYGAASPTTDVQFIPSLVPSKTAVSSSAGADVNVFRQYMMVPGVKPSLGCLTYFGSEFGALTPFTCTVLGSAHTYMPMGAAMNNWSANALPSHCAAIRWE